MHFQFLDQIDGVNYGSIKEPHSIICLEGLIIFFFKIMHCTFHIKIERIIQLLGCEHPEQRPCAAHAAINMIYVKARRFNYTENSQVSSNIVPNDVTSGFVCGFRKLT
jgi:hypothetical protein